jgi:hypothetical protein
MKLIVLARLGKIVLLLASMHAASCAGVDENALQRVLDASVGEQFSKSRWGGPTVLKRVIRDDGELSRIYEFFWGNGCSHQIFVRKADGVITGWKLTSEPKFCEQVMHRSLGS